MASFRRVSFYRFKVNLTVEGNSKSIITLTNELVDSPIGKGRNILYYFPCLLFCSSCLFFSLSCHCFARIPNRRSPSTLYRFAIQPNVRAVCSSTFKWKGCCPYYRKCKIPAKGERISAYFSDHHHPALLRQCLMAVLLCVPSCYFVAAPLWSLTYFLKSPQSTFLFLFHLTVQNKHIV